MNLTKPILVLYHADCLDGFGAAFAAWTHFKDAADYLPIQYGDILPDVKDKEVYLLDFAFVNEQLALMHTLHQEAKSWKVIDHHATAVEQLQTLPAELCMNCLLDNSQSGAALAWTYFNPRTAIPLILRHVQDGDLFKFEMADSKEICLGLRYYVGFNFRAWQVLSQMPLHNLVLAGKIIQSGQEIALAELRNKAHVMNLDGISGLAINADVNSYKTVLGNELAEQSQTFGAVYQFLGDKWKISLRSLKDGTVNVRELAEQFNGGGHDTAASFYCDNSQMLELLDIEGM